LLAIVATIVSGLSQMQALGESDVASFWSAARPPTNDHRFLQTVLIRLDIPLTVKVLAKTSFTPPMLPDLVYLVRMCPELAGRVVQAILRLEDASADPQADVAIVGPIGDTIVKF
jgi:hypothetical protein